MDGNLGDLTSERAKGHSFAKTTRMDTTMDAVRINSIDQNRADASAAAVLVEADGVVFRSRLEAGPLMITDRGLTG